MKILDGISFIAERSLRLCKELINIVRVSAEISLITIEIRIIRNDRRKREKRNEK